MSKNDEAAAKGLGQQPGAPTRLPDIKHAESAPVYLDGPVEGTDLAGSNRNSDTAQANPPLSAPTNTDELDKILEDYDIGHPLCPPICEERGLYDKFKSELARLIALKQREELQNLNLKDGRLFRVQERINELNTIIGSDHE